jgi:uncharacterized membrane protein
MVDQDRPRDAGESGSGTATDSGSDERGNGGQSVTDVAKGATGGQSVTDVAKGATGEAAKGLETATQVPSMDFKAVLRDAQRAVTDELKAGIAQAATETAAPAARKAAEAALVYATTKAPGLVENVVKTTIAPKLKEAGGAKAVAGAVLSKFPGVITKFPGAVSKIPAAGALGSMLGKGGGGGGGGGAGGGELKGTGRGRRLPLQAEIDVSVPIRVAYDQWTQFEEFPKFMFRVERIEQQDDTHMIWHEKIWGVRRQWEAEIVEQRPNERIVWRSTSGPQNVGVINFHQLHDPRLTRVQVNIDFQPTGLIEKTGRGWRAAIRALDTDLQRFKAYVEMKDAASGAWRGRIKDAEVQGEEGEEGEEGEQQPGEGQPPAGEQAEAEARPEAEEPAQAQAQPGEAEQQPEGDGQPKGQPRGEQPRPEAAETESSTSPERGDSGDEEPSSTQGSDEDEGGEPVVSQRRRRKG